MMTTKMICRVMAAVKLHVFRILEIRLSQKVSVGAEEFKGDKRNTYMKAAKIVVVVMLNVF